MIFRRTHQLISFLIAASLGAQAAEPLAIEISSPDAPSTKGFQLGTAVAPDGSTIGINSRHLIRDGKPWMPVMGEFHFSRYPADEWREELLRMKAGGIDIVATYVFWNHHEEVEGEWDWSGQRDLRKFVQLCGETGMLASVRLGPWCHGEVRNGGVPDWALKKGWKLRSNDSAYLDQVRVIYGQIAKQLEGLLWKNGGPVFVIQVENEYRGHPGHLLKLKEIAREAGLDVPLYTRTGWPALSSPMPFGEIAPLFGAYAEGFWDRKLRSMPGKYWTAFRFSNVRTDAAIATEQLGERASKDEADAGRYPYLTCEIGGGMVSSYHRRILMHPEDVEAVALAKVGSGGNLPGYYMYHGGVNPEGKLTTLMEEQATPMTNYNDMPVKNYDFQAPLGSFGQTRPHYHWLRRLHLMARDFGAHLAPMPSFLPATTPQGAGDLSTLRWAVRSNGEAGFLFVNNHQRSATLPAHEDLQFALKSPDGEIVFPAEPFTLAPGARFIWPFRLPVGGGLRLEYASAQLVCRIDEENARTLFFAGTPGVRSTFSFSDGTTQTLTPGRKVGLSLKGTDREIRVVLLGETDSLALWKGKLAGRERVVLSPADVIFDQGALHLRSEDPQALAAWVYPPLGSTPNTEGIFGKVPLESVNPSSYVVKAKQIRKAGAPREISTGRNKVATAPGDGDFARAAAWEIRLPSDLNPAADDALLRIHYRGDVARIRIGDQLVMDDFYNGRPLEVGLRRHAEALQKAGSLTLEILPFRADAPVFLPDKPKSGQLLELDSVTLVPRYTVRSSASR